MARITPVRNSEIQQAARECQELQDRLRVAPSWPSNGNVYADPEYRAEVIRVATDRVKRLKSVLSSLKELVSMCKCPIAPEPDTPEEIEPGPSGEEELDKEAEAMRELRRRFKHLVETVEEIERTLSLVHETSSELDIRTAVVGAAWLLRQATAQADCLEEATR